ncbi:MAG: hypothetical protein P1V81_16305 [Planctomycetota bacterium]|nr:hypothetical protein [Planctomycetota bacterium]
MVPSLRLASLLLSLLPLAACHPTWVQPTESGAQLGAATQAPQPEPPAPWTPPPGWRTSDRPHFEATLAALDATAPRTPDPAALELLTELAGDPVRNELALRAALLLATLDHPRADAALAELLEAREPRPSRPADAALCVAAARLGLSPFAAELDLVPRLEALCQDGAPHPDLEVRVECARSALIQGSTAPVDFLLRVLRLGTPLGLERDGAWRDATTTTWSRHRAGEALADLLGIRTPYNGDASLAAREVAALELERLVHESRAKSE